MTCNSLSPVLLGMAQQFRAAHKTLEKIGKRGATPRAPRGIAALSLLGLALLMLVAPGIAHAQEPALHVVTQARPDPVTAGGQLCYEIILTNTGDTPLSGLVVTAPVPDHTAFHSLSARSEGWLMGTTGQGQTLQAVWGAQQPLAPGEAVRLLLYVQVDADYSGPLTIPGCQVIASTLASPLLGEAVIITVLPALPTSTPIPTDTPRPPTPTSVPPPTATPLPTPTPPPVSAAFSPSPTPSPLPSAPSPQLHSENSLPIVLLGTGGLLLIGVLLVWMAKR